MSHRRKRNEQRKEQARKAAIQERRERPLPTLVRRGAGMSAVLIRQLTQMLLAFVGAILFLQALIPWTSDLLARAILGVAGLGAFGLLGLHRRLVR